MVRALHPVSRCPPGWNPRKNLKEVPLLISRDLCLIQFVEGFLLR